MYTDTSHILAWCRAFCVTVRYTHNIAFSDVVGRLKRFTSRLEAGGEASLEQLDLFQASFSFMDAFRLTRW